MTPEIYLWIKTAHIVSSTILFGTGIGTAFQMWFTHRSNNINAIAVVTRNVVLADFLFTLPAVILQPTTGLALVWLSGLDPFASWLIPVYGLYILAGACWLPVVWLQIRMRDLAVTAMNTKTSLPPDYYRYMRIWFVLGWPAFIGLVVIFWLMVAKPSF